MHCIDAVGATNSQDEEVSQVPLLVFVSVFVFVFLFVFLFVFVFVFVHYTYAEFLIAFDGGNRHFMAT